jgi:hypothetical protein
VGDGDSSGCEPKKVEGLAKELEKKWNDSLDRF